MVIGRLGADPLVLDATQWVAAVLIDTVIGRGIAVHGVVGNDARLDVDDDLTE